MRALMMTSGLQLTVLVTTLVFCLLLSGCGFNRTGWHTRGQYMARVTAVDGEQTIVTRPVTVSKEAKRGGRIHLCDENAISISLVSNPGDIGAVVGLEIEFDGNLCYIGIHEVIGGRVTVWEAISPDGRSTQGADSDAWTISGTVEVRRFKELAPPPTKIGKKADVEMVAGVFDLVVEHDDGDRIILEHGSFEFVVEARRYQWEP